MQANILVYQDYVHNNDLLLRVLKPYGNVGGCDAADIVNGILTGKVGLFVMPGGADLYYCEKLNGAGNSIIRRYVETGGSYLGICAGAYYACTDIEWAKGTDQEISGPRELGFAKGIAKGPVYEFLESGDINKSWHHAAPIHFDDGTESFDTLVSYRAGPLLPEFGKVLARYDRGPAIIECSVGNGLAILSSPHIEHIGPAPESGLYKNLNLSFAHEKSVCDRLAPHTESQSRLWARIIGRLMYAPSEKARDAA